MRITIAAVGRMRAGPERNHFEHYVGRIKTWPIALREIEIRRPLPADKKRDAEGKALAEALPAEAIIVALDEAGRQFGSQGFAERMAGWRDDGVGQLAFVIGGADGLTPALRDSSHQLMSLGAYTWPHMLVRTMLAEQIYRAQQILSGHPYHRA